MALSVFDLFTVGIGPSSSHTVGPMRAARRFVTELAADEELSLVHRVRCELFGSLGATGHGHGSEGAVILGLMGEDPATVETHLAPGKVADVREQGQLNLLRTHPVAFDFDTDLVLHRRKTLPGHPNGMTFTAFTAQATTLRERTYYSVGGGTVLAQDADGGVHLAADTSPVPHPFTSAAELVSLCEDNDCSMSELVMANELTWRTEPEVRKGLSDLWAVMGACVEAGCRNRGVLPGGLRVPRRAPALYAELCSPAASSAAQDPLEAMDWVNLFALAVNEENASGGRVVTAPTNGAAGIIPAVLHYYTRFVPGATERDVHRFFLTATAIGTLFKRNASISGAEVGCQGEVGSACSMAAAALCEVLGGTPSQVENAAEIGIEHHLGLTCDPVGGLVQIPCIERNAVAAVTAINAARLALRGDGVHTVSLDKAIKTMRETGRDMHVKYKETARGGLAVNVIEC